jgi:hypothetical protein
VHFDFEFSVAIGVRVARDERQEIVQRYSEITPGAARPLTQKDQLLSIVLAGRYG